MSADNPFHAEDNAVPDARQALDDLTVLSDVDAPDMGDASLNALLSSDAFDGGVAELGIIHQGPDHQEPVDEAALFQVPDVIGEPWAIDQLPVPALADDGFAAMDGAETFLFDFGAGHDTVTAGWGQSWIDTLDFRDAGAMVPSLADGGQGWTVQVDAGLPVPPDAVAAADVLGGASTHDGDGTFAHVDLHAVDQVRW